MELNVEPGQHDALRQLDALFKGLPLAPAAMRELGLDADDAAAVARGDRDALLARGAHPYLVFMADLRLRMEREPVSFEFF